jgi:molybdopterin converting factor subunit 1
VRVRVQYYAVLREQRGVPEEEIEFDGSTTLDLYTHLQSVHQFSLLPRLIRFAVNGAFVPQDHRLENGDLVVFIPPVAGG